SELRTGRARAVARRRREARDWVGLLDQYPGVAQRGDGGVVVTARVAQDLVGIRAEARGGRADAAVIRRHAPGDTGVDAPADVGMLELDEVASLAQMGALDQVAVARRHVRWDTGGLQRGRGVFRRARRGPRRDELVECVLV